MEFETAAFELPERLYYYELTELDRTEIEAAVDTSSAHVKCRSCGSAY